MAKNIFELIDELISVMGKKKKAVLRSQVEMPWDDTHKN